MSDRNQESQTHREAQLDQAALALIALVPGDLQGVVQFDALLNSYLENAPDGGKDCVLIAQAADLIAAVIVGEKQLDAVVDPIGSLIEQAMDALDDPPADPVSTAPLLTEPDSSGDAGATVAGPGEAVEDADPEVPQASTRTSDAGTDGENVATVAQTERVPEDADLLPDFVAESIENLEAAEGALLALEADPSDVESVNVIFRAFHTVKGTSGFLGLDRVQELAHHAESLLSRVRDGEVTFVGGVADLALRASDLLKALILSLRNERPGSLIALPDGYPETLALLMNPDGVTAGGGTPIPSAGQPSEAAAAGASPISPARAEPDPNAEVGGQQAPKRSSPEPEAEQSVRVRTDRLDRLVDLVGELVVAQAMVVQDPQVRGADGADLAKKVVQAGKIVRDLQDLSMGLRMVPFRPAFQKIARVVRDVARKSGKEVDFVTEGEDTEIDRSMVDVIGDPLVHMIRNAVDHGLEPPAEREAAGKPARGVLRLAAYQEGGGVVVELSDDGRGLDPERIFKKAVDRGLVEPDRILSDKEIFALIFAPGFSTAEKVTDLSGRGVGMDVVRRSVESLHGRIEIDSELGHGTHFRVILPLTLAITDGMLIRVGSERYIIPTVSIETSLRPTPESLSTVYERGEMVLLHGQAIPIVCMHEIFGIADAVTDPTRALLVVVGEGTGRVALLVDELLGQQQFVAKPLGDGLGRVEGLAGGAVLGDGRVGLILDCAELIAIARDRNGLDNARAA